MKSGTTGEVFGVAFKLGLTSFGGPVAHLGYFHNEYVSRRGWLSEAEYAELVALAQALPGPASSQVGMAVGYSRAGVAGAAAAWLGFTLPSAVLMVIAAWLWTATPGGGWEGVLRGLSWAALAVVTQAVWTMGRAMVKTWVHLGLAVGALAALTLVAQPWTPVGLIAVGALVGVLPRPGAVPVAQAALPVPRSSWVALGVLAILLAGLPWLHGLGGLWALADGFYRVGSLVFGGGHVVLPLLESEFVGPGLLSPEQFLAGYGLAQALPGPLFTLSSYLGYLLEGPVGALVALVGVFLPSFLLVVGVLPFWGRLRGLPWFSGGLGGINAVVVGLLAAAWYHPVLTESVHGPVDALAAAGLVALLVWAKTPPWVLVPLGVAGGVALTAWGL